MKVNILVPGPQINMYKFSGIRIPQIGPVYLGTILKNAGFEVKIYDENLTELYDKSGLRKEILDADAFAISILTPSASKGYQLAKIIEKQKPDAYIAIGGMHASALPEEALKFADCVVVGEGEEVVVDLFKERPKGIIRTELVNLDSLPIPDFSLLENHHLTKYYPILSSRGCPYNCNFCQVPVLLKRKFRKRSADAVFEEIQERVKAGQNYLFFNDDIFGLNLDEVLDFLERVARKNLKLRWATETRADLVVDHPELVELMRRTNCRRIHIGIESANPATLEAYNKKLSLDKIKKCAEILNQNQIKINAMFMLGSDEDDEGILKHTIRFIRECKFSSSTASILYPIPSTPLYKKLEEENRIITRNWDWYDGTHVVFLPLKIAPIKLQYLWRQFWKKIYNIRRVQYMFPIRYFLHYWKKLNQEYLKVLKIYANKPLAELEITEYLKQLPSWFRENFKIYNGREMR